MTVSDAASFVARLDMHIEEAAKLCGCRVADVEKALRGTSYAEYVPTPAEIRAMCQAIREWDEMKRWADVPESQRSYYQYGQN